MIVRWPEEPDRRRPLRILVCISHFYPTVGGAEQQILGLARDWVERGHAVRVLTRVAQNAPAFEVYHGVEIDRCIRTVSLGPLFGLSFLSSLGRALAKQAASADVILAGQGPWEAVATGAIAATRGTPTVARIATSGSFGDLQQATAARGAFLWKKLLLRNTRFLALSKESCEEAMAFGAPTARVRCLPNGVDPIEFHPPIDPSPDRERTVLFAGRLAPQKNPRVLLDAWRRLPNRSEYRLWLAGAGPLDAELREFCRREGLDNVRFLGKVADMPALYHRACVFALPSRGEGCSNALLEAMASGLCPVVSAIRANAEVVTAGQSGLLAPVDDADALAGALSRALVDAELRQRLAFGARAAALRDHDRAKIADGYLQRFRELVAERQRCAASRE